jgi:hypothetical protein
LQRRQQQQQQQQQSLGGKGSGTMATWRFYASCQNGHTNLSGGDTEGETSADVRTVERSSG